MADKDYVVVTTISSHRIRYVMHRDDLQKLNFEVPIDSVEWANDTVSSGECDEFSQEYMGEYIVDTVEMNEDDMLNLFDKDNDYLSEWTKEQKLELVRRNVVKEALGDAE
jgi:hypothetical protein